MTKEERKEYNKKYYEENKDKRNVYIKNFKEKNPGYSKEYYEKHKDKIYEYQVKYRKKNSKKFAQLVLESKKRKVEQLRSQGCKNAWMVVNFNREPKYKVNDEKI